MATQMEAYIIGGSGKLGMAERATEVLSAIGWKPDFHHRQGFPEGEVPRNPSFPDYLAAAAAILI